MQGTSIHLDDHAVRVEREGRQDGLELGDASLHRGEIGACHTVRLHPESPPLELVEHLVLRRCHRGPINHFGVECEAAQAPAASDRGIKLTQ